MALTELTKVTGPGIHTLSNVLSHNIKSSGIITATKFSGPLDSIGGNFAGVITATNGVFSGNISAVDGNFSGNVTIGGTLTYEDVTNIDSVGIITAQKDIHVGAGLSVVGVSTFSNGLFLPDNKQVKLGNTAASPDFKIYHNTVANTTSPPNYLYANSNYIDSVAAANLFIRTSTAGIYLGRTDGNHAASFHTNGSVVLYHNASGGGGEKFRTNSTGINVIGNVVSDGLVVDGNSDLNGDLDVDGHTNLDNVSIAGITTFSDDVKFTGANYNVLWDKSDNSLKFDALAKIKLNDSFQFYHNTNGVLHNTSGTTYIYGSGSGNISIQAQVGAQNISCGPNGNTSLYYAGGQKLYTVSDGVYVNDNLGIQDSIQHILDTNTKIRFPAADTVTIETAGSERLRIDSSGNVLIGTTATSIYNDSSGEGIVLRGGDCIDIARSGDNQLYLNRQSSDGYHIAFIRDGSYKSFIATRSNAFCIDVNSAERLRIGSAGQIGIAGANYGSSGQVLTSGGSGSAITWTTPTVTTINNNADNRLITGSGTANTLNGESTLTYDGTTFTIGSGKNMVMYGPSGTAYSLSVEPIVSTPYGIRVKEPSTVSNGYPLIVASTNSGATLFRVLSGTGVAETRTMQPVTNNTYDLGTSSKRYANIYTQDLQLSNEAVGDNGIDGTWGNYTIVEGESDLFLKNNRSGKTYKFNLTEVS